MRNYPLPPLAEYSSVTLLSIALGAMIIIYFAVRFWLNASRPSAIKDISTPTIDRMNERALGAMANSSPDGANVAQAAAQEAAPSDLVQAVPKNEPKKNPL